MLNIFGDGNLQAEYEEKGFASAILLSVLAIKQLLAEIAGLHTNDGSDPANVTGSKLSHHVSSLDASINYMRRVFQLVNDFFSDKLHHPLPKYRILNASLIIKPPGGGLFEVHHDWSFVADQAVKCMTVWCPLVDTSLVNGTINVLPCSNRLVLEFRTPKAPSYLDNIPEEIIRPWLQPIPTKAGHALLWDNHMIHWSGDNFTDAPRIAVLITCIPSQCQPVFFFYDKQSPEIFEIMDADHEFWLTTNHQDLFTRQPGWKSLGFMPNENRLITEVEFAELLRT